MENDVLRFLDSLRESFSSSVYTYTNGGCYSLFKVLKSVFPNAVAWYDCINCHVYTEINGKFYDITGQHDKKDEIVEKRKRMKGKNENN